MRRSFAPMLFMSFLFAGAFTIAASAAAPQRTFVSTGGNDANPCSLVAPCRGFAAAVAAVAANGEVVALDSGGYGPVTITQSVSIIAPSGIYAGISVLPGNDGVAVNAPGAVVTVKGLTINGLGGNAGINFIQGATLTVENCEIANIGGGGAIASVYAHAAGGLITVRNTIVREAPAIGIRVDQATSGQTTTLVADNLTVQNSAGFGIYLGLSGAGTAEAYLSHVTVTGSGGIGIIADSQGGGPTLVSVTNSTISGNGSGVVSSTNAGVKLIVATSTIARNANYGLHQVSSGTLLSRGDNTVHDNNGGGAQTFGTIGLLPPL